MSRLDGFETRVYTLKELENQLDSYKIMYYYEDNEKKASRILSRIDELKSKIESLKGENK